MQHVYKITQLVQRSDKRDTSLAVESALCTTGSPRRWSQRVSRKCYESVGAAKDVIMPLPYQLDKAKPSASKIQNARSYNFGLTWFTVSIWSTKHHAIAKLCTLFASIGEICAQKNAPYAVIRQMRYLTGCGISPLHHRFTPKMESKGVSEMLWKCRSRKRCHHATPISTWQGKTLWKQNQECYRSYNFGLMVHCFYMINKTSCNCKLMHAICQYRCNMCTRLCTLVSDQTNAIPHWLWNQPSAPPVHPEDGVKGCLGNAVQVSEPQKMSSCHSHINLTRQNPLQAKSRMLGHITLGWHGSLFLYDQQNIMQLQNYARYLQV